MLDNADLVCSEPLDVQLEYAGSWVVFGSISAATPLERRIPTCYGAQRRLFLRLCLTASSCTSGDQYFNMCNSLRSKSVIHSLNAALKSNINGLP